MARRGFFPYSRRRRTTRRRRPNLVALALVALVRFLVPSAADADDAFFVVLVVTHLGVEDFEMRGATRRRRRLLVRVLLGPDVDALLLQLGG